MAHHAQLGKWTSISLATAFTPWTRWAASSATHFLMKESTHTGVAAFPLIVVFGALYSQCMSHSLSQSPFPERHTTHFASIFGACLSPVAAHQFGLGLNMTVACLEHLTFRRGSFRLSMTFTA